jgi:hypothetical protein
MGSTGRASSLEEGGRHVRLIPAAGAEEGKNAAHVLPEGDLDSTIGTCPSLERLAPGLEPPERVVTFRVTSAQSRSRLQCDEWTPV